MKLIELEGGAVECHPYGLDALLPANLSSAWGTGDELELSDRHDTMQRARKVFGVREAAICTQRFHLPRALYLARASGIDAVGVIADRRRYQSELYNEVRESIARAVAVLDLTFGREARWFGPPISLRGDGRVTHDGNLSPPTTQLLPRAR